MPTIREYLGDEKIAKLESMGFLPSVVTELAKTQYYKERQAKRNELSDAGLGGDLVQKVMRGEIDEKTAFDAQKIDKQRGWVGIGKGAVKGIASVANAAERVYDFLNPSYEGEKNEKGEYVYKNAIGKGLAPSIKRIEEMEQNWSKANPDEWNIKGAVGEMFGSLATDPINFIPLASGANLGRKMLYYASTGALSNSIYGTGVDKNKNALQDAAVGAGAGVVFGGVMELAVKGIGKLISKAKDTRIKESSSQSDIDALNNDEFLNMDFLKPLDEAKNGAKIEPKFNEKDYIESYLYNESAEVKAKVYDDLVAGKEKSVIDDEKFNDIKNFKSNIEFLSNPSKVLDFFTPLKNELESVKNNILRARESSLTQYADMQKTAHRLAKENPNLKAKTLSELVNLAHKPSEEEAFITSLINNGQGVENRLGGYRILYAIENSFGSNIPAEMFYSRLKKAGFGDEAAEAFTKSYESRDINIASEYIGNKVDIEGEKFAIDNFKKLKEAEAKTDEISGAESAGEAGRVSDSLFDLGDNAGRREAGQESDAQISQHGGPDTAVGSENLGRAKIDEAVEERGAVKFDDADNARFGSEQVVSKERENISKSIEGVDNKSGETSNILAEAFTGKTFHVKPLSENITPQIKNTGLKNLLKGDIVRGGDTLSNLSTPPTAKQGLEAADNIISQKLKNGEDIDFGDKKVVNKIQKSVDNFVKDSLKDINVKDEILREFDLKNVKTLAKSKATELNEAQIKTLKKDISNSQIKSINENKFYFDKVGKDGDKKRFFLDIDENGAVKIDGFNKADIDEIHVRKSAMDELIGKDKLKGMSFEEKAAYHNELDPIKKEKIVKTAELNRLKREMRGIYNVINNGKESANVYKDLQKIDDAIKLEAGSNKKGGGVHIQKHLDPASKGAVTQQEVMNIGNNVREYLKKYKEPFIDKDGGKIYEWQDKDGIRFRVAIYDKTKKSVGAGSTTRITTTDAYESIITFYSDRNLNRQMEFLDPRVSVEAKFEEFKAKNLDEDGNIKDGLELC